MLGKLVLDSSGQPDLEGAYERPLAQFGHVLGVPGREPQQPKTRGCRR